MTKAKTGGAASAASVGGVAATSTESTATKPSLENQISAPPVDSTASTAPVLDLWVLNSGVKAITESRTRTLLAVDRTTQIKISSPKVRATVIRNLEQLNHLAGAEYLKVVDQPPILDKVE